MKNKRKQTKNKHVKIWGCVRESHLELQAIQLFILKVNATVIYVFFLIDCITARIVYVSKGLSFARERFSKHWAQLHTFVGNCVEKWQNRHICHFDLLSSDTIFCYQRTDFVYGNKKTERNKTNLLAGKT